MVSGDIAVLVRFRDGSTEQRSLPRGRLAPVVAELELLGSSPAQRLAERLRSSAAGETIELAGDEVAPLLRALDHLRNLKKTARRECSVRDWLYGIAGGRPLRYDLQGWSSMPGKFVSYSGLYQAGDRLVAGDGTALRVSESVTPGDGTCGLLTCEPM